MSVDPYMRERMKKSKSYVPSFELGEPLEGSCIGEVIQSKNDRFSEGDQVLGNLAWRDLGNSSFITRSPQCFSMNALGCTALRDHRMNRSHRSDRYAWSATRI